MNAVEFTKFFVLRRQARFPYLGLFIVLGIWGSYSCEPAIAQIVGDNTLGNEASVVTFQNNIRGSPAELIQGGATRGTNLFHSFQEFNVNEGQRVYFANPTGIDNILSRVTGRNVSNILGTLGVDGGANLFFLNPNGIIFGENARLDIAGSFVASTANSLVFENGFSFNTANPETLPLLNITVPIGLQYGANPGNITNQSVVGLQVQSGKTLALVGGDVAIEGGVLSVPA